jgi:hypothetical protein
LDSLQEYYQAVTTQYPTPDEFKAWYTHSPAHFTRQPAIADGSCQWDSVAQGLSQYAPLAQEFELDGKPATRMTHLENRCADPQLWAEDRFRVKCRAFARSDDFWKRVAEFEGAAMPVMPEAYLPDGAYGDMVTLQMLATIYPVHFVVFTESEHNKIKGKAVTVNVVRHTPGNEPAYPIFLYLDRRALAPSLMSRVFGYKEPESTGHYEAMLPTRLFQPIVGANE